MQLDFERLRNDLIEECYVAAYGGGYGIALIDEVEIEDADEKKLIEFAKHYGFSLRDYMEE